MKWRLGLIVALGCCLFACGPPDVEQIDVAIPEGVTVPEGMVYIPEGGFVMGHADHPKTEGGKKVVTDAFFIDRFEVSRGDFQTFKPEAAVSEKKAAFPVAHVTYAEARAYCESLGKRLPQEVEWEKAARGVDGRKWPWSQYYEHPNNGFSGFLPEKVDQREEWISPYGVYGMGHNVWEWVADDYAYAGQPEDEKKRFKVIRGGLIQTHLKIEFSPTYFRNWMEPTAAHNFLGFRCARDVG